MPRVQFLSFEGCPLAAETRNVLEQALKHVGRQPDDFLEIDVLDPATPPELARWGSPTILVNGLDVAGHEGGDAPGCRVYDTPDRLPRLEVVVHGLLHNGCQ
ncbi:MAG: hypothetical protein KJO85_09385 [Gammaproteobacteria bacterium]|nr:hypothetical protein [Gammaproteobacteria bacterium]